METRDVLRREMEAWLSEESSDHAAMRRIQKLFEKGLTRGDDGRLHGEAKAKAKEFRAFTAYVKNQVPQSSVEDFLESAVRYDTGTFHFSLERLIPLAHEGSLLERRLLRSRVVAIYGEEMMRLGDIKSAAVAYAAAYRLEGQAVSWELSTIENALVEFGALSRNAQEDPEVRADALLVVANINFMRKETSKALSNIRLAQLLQPSDSMLWNTEGCFLSMLMKIDHALAAFNKAKSLGSDEIDRTLFHRAVLMIKQGTSHDEAKAALEEFVTRAAPGSRKLCEAYYRLAVECAGDKLFGSARRFYDLGISAEKFRCVLFGDEALNHRIAAKAIVGKFSPCGNPKCPHAGHQKCSKCKMVVYCSVACQQHEWPSHKADCKKSKKGK
mmetsp:Transcript_84606/g.169290  ORF Transcript_84606/g.169290 Transcript_84606/m.169290 type:complete len:385 (+) Transcript_84606:197-1351(+)